VNKSKIFLLSLTFLFLLSGSVYGEEPEVSYVQFKLFQTRNIHNTLRLNTVTGEIVQIQNNGLKFLVTLPLSPNDGIERYSLHKTKNMWTYILLDETKGKLWQCQFSVKEGDDSRFCLSINSSSLSSTTIRKFSIQPLTSMFQYYLINQLNGEMWMFQWSTKDEDGYRWIKKQ
jgi:hypothetical protein